MNKKLQDIYAFLKANRSYNKPIQIGSYKMALLPYETTFEKVYALLYNTLNSQSQVNMDKSAIFFKRIAASKSNLNSLADFLKTIGGTAQTPLTYKSIFELLTKQESWGDKTAALFVKAVYHCHVGYANEFHFWNDAPKELSKEDELFLPVDAVIYFIFKTIGSPCSNTFLGINKYLKINFSKSNFEVWDDLWFWGFITQKSSGKTRIMQFNEEKYWNLLDAPKDQNTINKTKQLANQFIDLIKRN
ncbi:MAG: hypothetical protein ABIQ27_12420 [Flavobacterium sp.]|uniref:hypothetical protein n=1 Tax=Flavobacterium sp. TaxID=239 RepID=UPI003264C943